MSIKLTKKRSAILNTIKEASDLVSAANIQARLPEIDLATIYRNLDLFTKEGIIKKLQFDDEAKYEYQEEPHHHAICNDCGHTTHFTVPEETLAKLLPIKNFATQSIDITVKGNCTHGHKN